MGSIPAVPVPSGRRIAPTADSTPRRASPLTSMPSLVSSETTTARTSGSTAANSTGAWRGSTPDSGRRNSGQANAASPATLATTSMSAARPETWDGWARFSNDQYGVPHNVFRDLTDDYVQTKSNGYKRCRDYLTAEMKTLFDLITQP